MNSTQLMHTALLWLILAKIDDGVFSVAAYLASILFNTAWVITYITERKR